MNEKKERRSVNQVKPPDPHRTGLTLCSDDFPESRRGVRCGSGANGRWARARLPLTQFQSVVVAGKKKSCVVVVVVVETESEFFDYTATSHIP